MNTIHLLGHGKQQAKKASEIVCGDVLMWNYGTTAKVIEIVSETANFITIKEEYDKVGISGEKVFSRRLKKDRLVAFC